MATGAVELDVQIPEAFTFLLDPPLGELRYRVAYGGRGSAKSWQFARALLGHGAHQRLRILCAREYQTSISDSVHRLLADQTAVMGLDGFYHVQQSSIVGENGTEFIFKGLRRLIAEIKSTEGLDLCWVEEAEAVSDESWRVLIPTVRKPGSEIWVSFNPALETDPTYKLFVSDPPPRSIVKQVGYKDNPWLPDVLREEARELQKRDPEAYANVWGGEPWTRSDAEVLAGKWKVDEFRPKEHWDGPYFGADWGFARDPSVLVKLWIADSRLYLEHEEGGVQLDTDDTERAFRRIPGAGEHTIRADSARPETINEMVRRGLRVVPAKKWEGSVKDGIDHLRSYEQIVINPRCKRAIQEARLWRYKTDPRTGDVLPVLMAGNEHVWDAVRYALQPMISQGMRPRFSIA
jgi:phage terminase large subunit